MTKIDKLSFEKELMDKGYKLIAGVDEAGRGPLAGPVVAACVIMNLDNIIEGVDDSKKLSAAKRAKLFLRIKDEAIAVGIGIVEHRKIDKINILNASRLAMEIAYNDMKIKADYLLADAMKNLNVDCGQLGIIRGDQRSYTIGAASIIAKETRDKIMLNYDDVYPEYGFKQHKGYGTKAHRTALKVYGISSIHRRSFMRNVLPNEYKKG